MTLQSFGLDLAGCRGAVALADVRISGNSRFGVPHSLADAGRPISETMISQRQRFGIDAGKETVPCVNVTI